MAIMQYVELYFKELWYLSQEMAPYLLLGLVFAGILHVYFPKHKIQQYLGKNNLKSVVNATILGMPLPLCSCGVIPTGVSFYQNGASKGATVSFLITTPQTGLDSILVSYSMLGLPFAILRPVVAMFTGIFGGWFTNVFDNKEQHSNIGEVAEAGSGSIALGGKLKQMLKYSFVDFLNDISKWLVIGLLLAAMIAVVLPNDFFQSQVSNEYTGLFIMLLASVPLYVCATSSVPIAAVLMAKGLSPGAAIVFLMAGPATNMATIMVIGKSMGRKSLVLYLLSIIGGSLLFGTLINEIDFIRSLITLPVSSVEHVHHTPSWVGTISAGLLLFLIINGRYRMKQSKDIKYTSDSNATTISVKGMSCGHCESSVERNVAKLHGVEEVKANFKSETVSLKGQEIDLNEVRDTINDLGYEWVEAK